MPKTRGPNKRKPESLTEREIKLLKFYAEAQCTTEDLALHFDISRTQLKRAYGPALRASRRRGIDNVRAKQYSVAMGDEAKGIPPDRSMLIWLGKVICRQAAVTKYEHTGKDGKALEGASIIVQLPLKDLAT